MKSEINKCEQKVCFLKKATYIKKKKSFVQMHFPSPSSGVDLFPSAGQLLKYPALPGISKKSAILLYQ